MAYSAIGAVFSPDSSYFAYASLDGGLKIWESSSNSLKQEYTPSSHLSSTCSALSWGPCQQSAGLQKKKAKRNRFSTAIRDLNLIAMGTLSGEILLYSVSNGDLHGKLTGGHDQAVSDISWLPEEDSLFTCSPDQHIIRWSISKGTIINKWKAGKSAVHAICVVDSENLLSASSAIFWWNLKNQTILKKFTGHAAEVFCLVPISCGEDSAKSKYFLSSAVGDRVVNVWQLNEDPNCNAIACFTLSDEPATLDILQNAANSQQLLLSTVTKSGVMHVFEHQLNGPVKKPLPPKISVQLATMANAVEKSQQLPILAAKLNNDSNCMVAYSSFMRPVFENMELGEFGKETFLIREKASYSRSEAENTSKIKQPCKPNSVKLLAPGYMTPSKPNNSVARKKKRKEDCSELPMEERLNALYLGQAPDKDEVCDSAPNSESMVHLLLQGLQSKDKKLLSTVLRSNDETLIRNTVERLPLNSIPQLLVVLHEGLTKKEQGNRPCLRWLKGVLSIHLSYLMSLKDIDEYIGPVSQLIEAREEIYPKMTQLKGFLDVLWSQIDSRTSKRSRIFSRPLTVYEDASSSDEVEEEDDIEHDDMEDDVHSSEDSQSEKSDCDESDDDMEEL